MKENGLDAVDIEILRLLQKDAEMTNKEIALKLHKSIATINERIRRLKDQGYIKRVVALLDGKKIKPGIGMFQPCAVAQPCRQNARRF